MLRAMARAFATGVCLLLPLAVLAQRTGGPESAIRELFAAIYANDVDAYNRITLPDPARSKLTVGGRSNPDKLRQLRDDPDSLQIKALRPLLTKGVPIADVSRAGEGTTGLYMTAHGGSPMVVALVRTADGWKVDVRWWLAMIDLQTAPPARGTPAFAARALTGAMIQLDRKNAERFAVPGASLDVLFAGAPRQREPSGQFDALAMEMPIVELKPGEFATLADGRVVESTSEADRKVLVGWFGPVEVPFVVRRVASEWRVEPPPFFAFFDRQEDR
jgi:hypothetical protein